MEVYELHVLPGRPRRADPHQAGVVEQLLVHAGRLRVGPEHDPVELGPGDFVAFDGSVAHVYEALGERSHGDAGHDLPCLMRAVFVLYLAVIVAGIAFFTVIGIVNP